MRDFDINQPAPEAEKGVPVGSMEDELERKSDGTTRRKKLRLDDQQSNLLKQIFHQNRIIDTREKQELASKLNIKPRQVEVWFQNRRARSKMKLTEMECAYLKESVALLIDENRRLQREVEELQALKMAPPNSNHTMCPGCKCYSFVAGADQCSTSPTTNLQLKPRSSEEYVGPK